MSKHVDTIEADIKDQAITLTDLDDWLSAQTDYQWLLAHAYDGVIWGWYNQAESQWELSSSVVKNSPQLRLGWLQELRLFGPQGECYLWSQNNQWQQRTITDGQGKRYDAYQEPQILWGTRGTNYENSFTIVADGQQGLHHAVPLDMPSFDSQHYNVPPKYQNFRPIKLIIRHYIDRDETSGLARIYASRLLELSYDLPEEISDARTA